MLTFYSGGAKLYSFASGAGEDRRNSVNRAAVQGGRNSGPGHHLENDWSGVSTCPRRDGRRAFRRERHRTLADQGCCKRTKLKPILNAASCK